MRFLSLLALLVIGFSACRTEDDLGPNPRACVEVDRETVILGDTVGISTCSEDALYSELFFGDGSNLTKATSTKHVYQKAGTFSVTVIAYPQDPRNEISKATKEITVLPYAEGQAPQACFTYQLQAGFEVQLINCSQNAKRFQWDFGDGNRSSELSPLHTFAAAGTYDVTLTALNGDGSASNQITQSLTVKSIGEPLACFEASTVLASPDEEIQFFNCSQNAARFEWSFGDGTISTQINANHAYQESGTYDVVLKAFNASGTVVNEQSQEVKIGDKYITGFRLLAYPETKRGGSTWDDEWQFPFPPTPPPSFDVQPDVKVLYGRGRNLNETGVKNDLKQSSLPTEWSLDRALEIDGRDYTIVLVDDDTPENLPIPGTDEDMAEWVSALAQTNEQGKIILTSGGVELEVLYDVR